MTAIPGIALNDGRSIPQVGYGVWEVPDDAVAGLVTAAVKAGYRSIDTAQAYGNEAGVGRGIKECGVPRDQLFVTSKLRNKDQGYDAAMRSLDGTLSRLGLAYLDLFLIHWPAPGLDRYSDTWKAFVEMQRDGRVRSIGVSNFLPDYIERIISDTGVTPAVNQIELHPEYQQRDVRDFHQRHNIAIESYSPLGRGTALDNDVVKGVAEKFGKSPAQVVIRWHVQQGLIVIPKSANPDRIRANIDIFDFALDDEDLARLASLDRADGKMLSHPATSNGLW